MDQKGSRARTQAGAVVLKAKAGLGTLRQTSFEEDDSARSGRLANRSEAAAGPWSSGRRQAPFRAAFWLGMLLLVAGWPAVADAGSFLTAKDVPGSLFPGRDAVARLVLSADDAVLGTVVWQLACNGRVLASGTEKTAVQPGQAHVVELRFRTPELKEGIDVRTTLSAVLREQGRSEPLASFQKDVWIVREDPFFSRKALLASLRIRLLDPEGRTAEVFSRIGIPFRRTSNPEALLEADDGIVVVGEGTSLKRLPGLAGIMLAAAESGTPVLCLAPSEGSLPVSELDGQKMPSLGSIVLGQEEMAGLLDDKIDAGFWIRAGAGRKTAVRIQSEGRSIVGRISDDGEGHGWPWIEVRSRNQEARLTLCGLKIVEAWDEGPSPRLLLAGLLERMSKDKEAMRSIRQAGGARHRRFLPMLLLASDPDRPSARNSGGGSN